MAYLGPEPAEFAPLPKAFYGGLVVLLEALAPPLLDRPMTKATPREDGIEVVLAHATELAATVWIQAQRDTIIVGCAALHEEHLDPAAALAVVAQLLCGQRTITTYDGQPLTPDFGARAAPPA